MASARSAGWRREHGTVMILFLLGRVLRAGLTMLACLTLVFVVLRISGDPATMLLPDDTPQDVLQDYRRAWGLDRPLPEQFLRYIDGVRQGQLGTSFAEGRPA